MRVSDKKQYLMLTIAKLFSEIEQHASEIQEHPSWYSGHKNKAKRAILTAREILLDIAKELDE